MFPFPRPCCLKQLISEKTNGLEVEAKLALQPRRHVQTRGIGNVVDAPVWQKPFDKFRNGIYFKSLEGFARSTTSSRLRETRTGAIGESGTDLVWGTGTPIRCLVPIGH